MSEAQLRELESQLASLRNKNQANKVAIANQESKLVIRRQEHESYREGLNSAEVKFANVRKDNLAHLTDYVEDEFRHMNVVQSMANNPTDQLGAFTAMLEKQNQDNAYGKCLKAIHDYK